MPASDSGAQPPLPGWPPSPTPTPLVPLRTEPKKKTCPTQYGGKLRRVECLSANPHRYNLNLQSSCPCLCGTNLRGLALASSFFRVAILVLVKVWRMITEEAVQPTVLGQGLDRMQPSHPSPPGSARLGPGCPPALVRESRQQARRSCMQPHAPPPGCSRGQAPGSVPPAQHSPTTCGPHVQTH